jgi:hypothetical protein
LKTLPAILLWLALGLTFFGSLSLAALFFPKPYDWRHTVISSLASPRDNPHAFGIACSGLAASGLLLIPFVAALKARLHPYAPKLTACAGAFLLSSAVLLVLSALVVPGHYRFLGLARTHEHLAQVASVAFCLALLFYLAAVLRLPNALPWFRPTVAAVVLAPVTALITSRLALLLAYEYLPNPVYLATKASLWSSLALWEWIGAVSVYLFLALVIFILPGHPHFVSPATKSARA